MSMLDAMRLARIRAEQQERQEHLRRAGQEAAQRVQELRRQIGAADPSPAPAAPARPAQTTRVAFASEQVRDASMVADQRRQHEERNRPQEGVQPGADDARTEQPVTGLKGATGQPGTSVAIETAKLESAMADAMDSVIGDGLDDAREFQQARRPSRTRVGATPAQIGSQPCPPGPAKAENPEPAPNYPCALADPVLERMAHEFAEVEDAKAAWPVLLARLKALLPASEAVQARVRVWDRRRDLVRQKKKAAQLAAKLKKLDENARG